MKQIGVSFNIDEDVVLAVSEQENIEDAISQELGWLHDSGMFVDSWSFSPPEQTKAQRLAAALFEYFGEKAPSEGFDAFDRDTEELLLRTKITLDVMSQLQSHANETSYGEPQAWIELPSGRSIEAVIEQEGLSEEEYYYSVRLHCTEQEYDNGDYHRTNGIVDQFASRGLSTDDLAAMLSDAIKVDARYPVAEELEFVFAEEILYSDGDKVPSLNGYLVAVDSLVSRLKANEPDIEDGWYMDNINFYPVYDPVNSAVTMHGHYYLEPTDETRAPKGVSFELPLSDRERGRLIDAFEAYCQERDGKSGLGFLLEAPGREVYFDFSLDNGLLARVERNEDGSYDFNLWEPENGGKGRFYNGGVAPEGVSSLEEATQWVARNFSKAALLARPAPLEDAIRSAEAQKAPVGEISAREEQTR